MSSLPLHASFIYRETQLIVLRCQVYSCQQIHFHRLPVYIAIDGNIHYCSINPTPQDRDYQVSATRSAQQHSTASYNRADPSLSRDTSHVLDQKIQLMRDLSKAEELRLIWSEVAHNQPISYLPTTLLLVFSFRSLDALPPLVHQLSRVLSKQRLSSTCLQLPSSVVGSVSSSALPQDASLNTERGSSFFCQSYPLLRPATPDRPVLTSLSGPISVSSNYKSITTCKRNPKYRKDQSYVSYPANMTVPLHAARL